MMGISGVSSRLVQALGVTGLGSSSPCLDSTCNTPVVDDDLMIRALRALFGMPKNGKIMKEKARHVVGRLGFMYGEEEEGEEVAVEELLSGLEQGSSAERQQLLRDAFKIFDEDGNGHIEAVELKKVLQCLGLDRGWDLIDIEKMLKAVDLNLVARLILGNLN